MILEGETATKWDLIRDWCKARDMSPLRQLNEIRYEHPTYTVEEAIELLYRTIEESA